MPNAPTLNRMRMKHLEVFRHVCEQHTLRQAAELAHMTQPAATKVIQDLEQIVGATLFLRDRRGMKLTPEGEVMRRHVAVLDADIGRMAQEVALVRDGGQGHIRLGVLPSLAPGLLTRSISGMLRAHPRVRFTVQEGSTNALLDALDRNQLDLAFARIHDRTRSERVRVTQIYSEPFAVVVRRGHALSRQASARRRWEDLSRATWVLPEQGTPMREMVDQLFAAHGALRPQPAVECHTLEKVADLIAGSDMVGVLPQSLVQHAGRGRRFTVLQENILFAPTNLVARVQEEPAPVVESFVRQVLQAAGEMKLAQR